MHNNAVPPVVWQVKEAVAAVERAGQFPPNLTQGERSDRIGKKLKELGYKEAEIPGRRSLARYLERLKVPAPARPICPHCHVHDDVNTSEHFASQDWPLRLNHVRAAR